MQSWVIIKDRASFTAILETVSFSPRIDISFGCAATLVSARGGASGASGGGGGLGHYCSGALVGQISCASQFLHGVVAWLSAGGAAALASTTAASSASPSPLPTAATAATLGLPPLPRLCYAAPPAETGLSRTQSLLIRLVGEVMDAIAKKEGGDTPGVGDGDAEHVLLGDFQMIGCSTDDCDQVSQMSVIEKTCSSVDVQRFSLEKAGTEAKRALERSSTYA
ncbi:hypothetical protein Pelo_18069 [Pelomyxa schiedti]|nr:hypothetical protein Pelo_18069 [Pelomyxa schiedti]